METTTNAHLRVLLDPQNVCDSSVSDLARCTDCFVDLVETASQCAP